MNEKMIFNSEARGGAQRPDYRAEIAGLLRGGLTPKPLKERILSYHENDIAAALELLSREDVNFFHFNVDLSDRKSTRLNSSHMA